jgi:DNA repair exonuclease SbcCD ATPase subunit
MRATKSKELKKEIEILSQTFGRIIDRKDTVIKASSKDIEEAEEQYNMALRSFFEAIENMISKKEGNCDCTILFYHLGMHTSTIDKLLDQYEQDVEQIKYEFREERARIIRDHDISKTELQDIIYNMEKSFLDSETAAEQNFQANMEELRNKVCIF